MARTKDFVGKLTSLSLGIDMIDCRLVSGVFDAKSLDTVQINQMFIMERTLGRKVHVDINWTNEDGEEMSSVRFIGASEFGQNLCLLSSLRMFQWCSICLSGSDGSGVGCLAQWNGFQGGICIVLPLL